MKTITCSASPRSGLVVGGSSLTPREQRGMRLARELFDGLRTIYAQAIAPSLGGAHRPINIRMRDLMDQIQIHSGGFMASHWKTDQEIEDAKPIDHREIDNVDR
ncbi:hypothetical protein [Pseudomonas fluorescens]|nr:hypothetical protein [Pseudomonas fluorescens]